MTQYPQTGDLWEYTPLERLYLIMERTDEFYQDYIIQALDNNEVMQYNFDSAKDLWRFVA